MHGMAVADPRMTAEEYFVAAEGVPYFTQLIDGVMVPNQPKYRHQRAVGLIHARLLAWQESTGRGVVGLPVDVVVDRYNVYAPDVWFIADASRVDPDELLAGIPDLVVEVRSPSTWRYDIGRKKRRYEQHGLRELWLVDTAAGVVVVFRRSPGSDEFDVELELSVTDTITSPLLPGFELALVEVFSDHA